MFTDENGNRRQQMEGMPFYFTAEEGRRDVFVQFVGNGILSCVSKRIPI